MTEPTSERAKTTRRRPDFVRDVEKELEAARNLRDQITILAGGDEDFIRDSLEGETDFEGLVSAIVASIGEDEAHSEGLKSYGETLDARRKAFDDRAAFKRRLLVTALEISGRPTIACDAGTVSLRPTPLSASIGEEADIPSEFWKAQPPKLDRKAVLAALKEGRDVPGAALSNGGMTISIKVR